MDMLTRLSLKGFKSIREMEGLAFDNLNVLIGPNGAGKSNLISFFRMMSWMTGSIGKLQEFIGKVGGASDLLFEGADNTREIEARFEFKTPSGKNEYILRLFYASSNTLIFAEERYSFSRADRETQGPWTDLGSGHRESALFDKTNLTGPFILNLFRRCAVYQFHNTSETARIRQNWDVSDNSYLKEDGANLAPFLLRLREDEFAYYKRIVRTIRQITPYFDDFVLEPDYHKVYLRWRERGSDIIFGPHQCSDGSLRIMALVALLLQPERNLPTVLLLDEPELGLHPAAINIISGLIRNVSSKAQVIVATQSANLLDYFEPKEIIVVNRPDRETTYQRLDAEKLEGWLKEYTLAELWEKNVLGGRP